MPLLVSTKPTIETLAGKASLEMLPRNCGLTKYNKIKSIPVFAIKSDFVAYASPDSTYAVTRRFFDEAQKEIIIGIYDFSADYMKELVLRTMQRGVKVSLMLDVDSKEEQALFDELAKFGCNVVAAPSCASKVIQYFPSSHEKVIVIDRTWTLVQSGNYSANSIPFNEKDGGDKNHFVNGNRDMGVAIKSKPLAEFFVKVLKRDMKLELDAEKLESLSENKLFGLPELVEAVPKSLPSKLFPSKTFKPAKAVNVTPILTPENYMDQITALIESATESIYIENQYIRSSQAEIARLLESIKKAQKKNNVDVRIVLGKLFGQKDYDNEVLNVKNLSANFKLKLGTNIRYINTNQFVHCHNKLIVIDGKTVLISSQNWSRTGVGAVGGNREAGLLIEYPDLAQYYTQIFESDWNSAFIKIPKPGKTTITPQALAKGNFAKVVPADYQEV